MTKIEFSMSSLQRSVLPGMEKAIDNLEILVKYSYQLSVPSDFKYKTYLSSLDDNFRNYKSKISSVKFWMYTSNQKFNDLVDEIRKNSVNLNNIQIGKKYSSIR